MAENQIVVLRKAREQMVEERRKVASALAKPFDRHVTPGARENMIAIHKAIEAIDKAVEDENR